MFFLVSCSSSVDPLQVDYFRSVYKPVLETVSTSGEDFEGSFKKVTFSADGMKIRDFAIWFTEQFNKGFVYEEALNEKLIHAEVKDTTELELINVISRHLNVEAITVGNTVFLGKVERDDKAVFIRKVKGVKVEDLRTIVENLSGSEGSALKGHVTSDGIVFMFDTERSLKPFANAFDQLARIQVDAWVVQLYLIDFKDSELKNLGIDLSASGNLAYQFLEGGLNPLDSGIKANVLLNALIDVSSKSEAVRIVGQPLFVMSDGSNFLFENKDSIPYIKRVATETGFIQDEDVEFIDSGIFIKCNLRELSQGSLLNLNITNSKILAFDENNLPIRNIVTVNSEAPLSSSGIYLLAQSDYVAQSSSKEEIGGGTNYERSTLQVFARVFKLDRQFKGLAKKIPTN